jgi:hypothetical protein
MQQINNPDYLIRKIAYPLQILRKPYEGVASENGL